MSYHAPKIINETDYDGRVVGGIIRYVFRHLDLDGRGVVVKVHPTKRYWNGEYRPWGGRAEIGWGTRLRCALAPASYYPRMYTPYQRRDSPGPWEVKSWKHMLVVIAAHEAMHLRQHRTKADRHGRYTEIETEWAAKRIHDAWVEDTC